MFSVTTTYVSHNVESTDFLVLQPFKQDDYKRAYAMMLKAFGELKYRMP